jgi:hypothetical protein
MFAFRAFDITRYVQGSRGFGLGKLCKEPKGVIDVRNHLIIHPEDRKNPAVSESFGISFSDGRGLCLKNKRKPGEGSDPEDPGFHANAEEFLDYMRTWISEIQSRFIKPAIAPPPNSASTTP